MRHEDEGAAESEWGTESEAGGEKDGDRQTDLLVFLIPWQNDTISLHRTTNQYMHAMTEKSIYLRIYLPAHLFLPPLVNCSGSATARN